MISIKSCAWVRLRYSYSRGPVCFMDLQDENDLRSFERGELEHKDIFLRGKLEISGCYTWIGLCGPVALIFNPFN